MSMHICRETDIIHIFFLMDAYRHMGMNLYVCIYVSVYLHAYIYACIM